MYISGRILMNPDYCIFPYIKKKKSGKIKSGFIGKEKKPSIWSK